jgi:hypothetical protein
MTANSRDPQAQAVDCTDDSRILSVPEIVAYLEEHYHAHIPGITDQPLVSERNLRRLLRSGAWPCTRTPNGHIGMTVRDLKAIWTPDRRGA